MVLNKKVFLKDCTVNEIQTIKVPHITVHKSSSDSKVRQETRCYVFYSDGKLKSCMLFKIISKIV